MRKKVKKLPVISIVIPTFNSERTLNKTLLSIRKQKYPQNEIEILIIDGGSKDKTLEIANKFKCKIIPNPRTELIYAKQLGFLDASGKYLLYIDSDEILENPASLKLKILVFQKNPKVKAVSPTGYKSPFGSSWVNDYINEFGDPFTFFIYRESKDFKHFVGHYKDLYNVVSEDKDSIVVNFSEVSQLPQMELWAGGCMFDLSYVRKTFPNLKRDPSFIALLFYLLIQDGQILGVTKNDPTLHDSTKNLPQYIRKISSRVRNNIFRTPMGQAGFSGREKFESKWVQLKKYLFIPYSFSIVLPSIDALWLALSRKKILYLIHLPLTVYTACLIIYDFSLKVLGIEVQPKTYGR